ncbi:carbon-nitrogen hydrolase family protein [Lignipirellula cremea]|uniref:N-carbamoyl-D-amino acid hydrolase n=1 Tax=Lignipirellula cremea TaxID=2528010 RepID=A0A518DWE7_9BACT|nr:carbon-nitrogen hydrolase family protein [Lignipirellula cremea]QDU96157.1 N-carbamoyl-D-amino acid hydrolase [Lignipirellula cremea]
MSTPYEFSVAGVQMDVQLGQADVNLASMLAALRQTAADGVHLTVFPECALAGYCFTRLDEARPHAQTIPGPATDAMAQVCAEHGVYVAFGMLEDTGDDLFNVCVLIGPAGIVGVYRKVHLPFLGVDRYTTPGDQPFAVHDIGGLKVGMLICYDGSFPEASRCLALDGADLIILPTNWPPGAEMSALHGSNTRAAENTVYFLAVDRIGVERGVSFIGRSRLCDPRGATIADAPHADPQIVRGVIDTRKARTKRLVRTPHEDIVDRIHDRRPEFYGRLLEPTAAAGSRPSAAEASSAD